MAKRTCSIPECQRPHIAKGMCSMHYSRVLRHGSPGGANPVTAWGVQQCQQEHCSDGSFAYGYCRRHVLAYVGWVVTDSGCHLWSGSRTSSGYGVIGDTSRTRAHRLSWELANERRIPAGMVVRHTCDTPACINPRHLLIGTDLDNAWDAIERGRRPVDPAMLGAEQCSAGHDLTAADSTYTVLNRRNGNAYRRCRECRRERDRTRYLGTTRSVVSR